jgi:flagellar hook protein FlgE
MFSGVTGLKAHQTRMDVIGNNVANVNTVGFKSGRVLFQEVFSQTVKSAGSPDAGTGRGGTNPMQVGLGLGIASIDTVMTRGSLQRTDNPTDLSIEGEGFFIVKGGVADTYKFTRAGNFLVDKTGNVVTPSGQSVYGWQKYTADANGVIDFATESTIEPLNIFEDTTNGNKRVIAAKPTSTASFTGNLDASATNLNLAPGALPAPGDPLLPTAAFTMPFLTYDTLGNEYKVNMQFYKTGLTVDAATGESISTWTWRMSGDGVGVETTVPGSTYTEGQMYFNESGIPVGDPANPADLSTLTPTIKIITDPDPANPTVGAAPINVSLNLEKLTMFSADSSAKPTFVDGYKPGSMVSFNIGSDGVVTGIYSNGQQKPIGLLALATFENPGGLSKVGENLFQQSTNSGEFRKPVKSGQDGAGTLNPGTLEMSNVDLSKEFTEMIVTQRGFQANSRIITSSDEMLQELINLKR